MDISIIIIFVWIPFSWPWKEVELIKIRLGWFYIILVLLFGNLILPENVMILILFWDTWYSVNAFLKSWLPFCMQILCLVFQHFSLISETVCTVFVTLTFDALYIFLMIYFFQLISFKLSLFLLLGYILISMCKILIFLRIGFNPDMIKMNVAIRFIDITEEVGFDLLVFSLPGKFIYKSLKLFCFFLWINKNLQWEMKWSLSILFLASMFFGSNFPLWFVDFLDEFY